MSDDEYFHDDEVDDFEGDLFWNEEGEIVLADDLAEHTLPSPVYAEDPACETMGGYSDWEYYSDDYYDDDPTILKNNPQEGSPVHRGKSSRSIGMHRGKKRKLAATSDIPNLSLEEGPKADLRATMPWFKGTVWRSSPAEKTDKQLYEPGIGERVALLSNWREEFRAYQPFSTKRRRSPTKTRKLGDMSTEKALSSPPTETSVLQYLQLNGSRGSPQPNGDEIAAPKDRKRRRISFAEGPHSLPKHRVVVEIPVRRVNGMEKTGPESPMETTKKPTSSRKRKVDAVEDVSTKEGTSKPRNKRIATGRAPVKTKESEKPPPLPTARPTRSKNK